MQATCCLQVCSFLHRGCCRVQDKLDQADIQWDLHLFADTVSSDAGSIGALIEQVANKVNAELVVLAQHNKVSKHLLWLLSVCCLA